MMRGIEMRKAFRTSRLMGLFAIVFGLMAFGASAAQAEPGAHWDVNGSAISGALLPTVQAKNDSPHSTLLTEVGASKVEILCAQIKFVNAKLHELGRATGKIHYEECVTILNETGKAAGACKPKSPGATAGLIETNLLDGLLKLHELVGGAKDDLLELLPTEGNKFVTIELGPLCSIGNKFDITGKAFIEDCLKLGLKEEVEHLFQEGPLTELFFGTNEATIDGSAWGFLAGEHAGMKFSGWPA
jgi:hypothetical protein